MMENTVTSPLPDDRWRQTHLGRLLGHAMRRFDARVLALMAHDIDVPLASLRIGYGLAPKHLAEVLQKTRQLVLGATTVS